jgi:hypothetical protein
MPNRASLGHLLWEEISLVVVGKPKKHLRKTIRLETQCCSSCKLLNSKQRNGYSTSANDLMTYEPRSDEIPMPVPRPKIKPARTSLHRQRLTGRTSWIKLAETQRPARLHEHRNALKITVGTKPAKNALPLHRQ